MGTRSWITPRDLARLDDTETNEDDDSSIIFNVNDVIFNPMTGVTMLVLFRDLARLVDGERNDDDDNSRNFNVQIPEGATMVHDLEQRILAQSDLDIGKIHKLNESSLQRLGGILGQSTNLRTIKICGDTGYQDSPRELCDLILPDNRSIRSLTIHKTNLSGSVPLHNFIRYSPNLTRITIIDCGFTFAGLNNFSESLISREADTIESMTLMGNNFGDTLPGWDNLFSALCNSSKLKKLWLMKCGVGIVGATALARLLTIKPSRLTGIHLDSNSIGDEGLVKLTDALKFNTTLSFLSLSNNQITERGWRALLNLVCSSESIQKVSESNHTLCDVRVAGVETTEALGAFDSDLLHASLRINCESRIVAVRNKIIWRHSRGDLDLGDYPFEAGVIPQILEVLSELRLVSIYRGMRKLRLESIYRVMRKNPDIMNLAKHKGNKRKRT